jgi:hypothetical protein
MSTYAKGTSVSPEKSKAEIERTLTRYGCSSFMYGWDGERMAVVAFIAHSNQIRFKLPLPQREEFRQTPTGKTRSQDAIDQAHEQEVRRRWRALALAIKAKLEVVESGIMTFEEEFMANIVLPSGGTVSEELGERLKSIGTSGLPPLLLGSGE